MSSRWKDVIATCAGAERGRIDPWLECDADEMYELLSTYRLASLAPRGAALRGWDAKLEYCEEVVGPIVDTVFVRARTELSSVLRTGGAPPMNFKRETLGRLHARRCDWQSRDLDVCIQPGDVDVCKSVLEELGYSPKIEMWRGSIYAVDDEHAERVADSSWGFGQLRPWSRFVRCDGLDSAPNWVSDLVPSLFWMSGAAYICVTVDVHYSINHLADIGLRRTAVAPAWDEVLRADGVEMSATPLSQSVVLAYRFYMDCAVFAEFKVRTLADLVGLARRSGLTTRWLEVMERFPRLVAPIGWVMDYLRREFNLTEMVVPEEIKSAGNRPIAGSDFGPVDYYEKWAT